MATKTTGSGKAPGLETWNPNIKAPGINKGTGAYFRGDIAGEGDYTQMNDAIQSSILQASKDVGKALKMYENDPSNPNGKGSLLKNKPNDNEQTAIKIILQSIENGWKGFFDIKTQSNERQQTGISEDYKRGLAETLFTDTSD